MKKLLLSLVAILTMSVYAGATVLNFSENSDFANWSSSYAKHVWSYDDGTVTFAAANKNTQTITDIPVTKGSDVEFVLDQGKGTLSSLTFTCRKWGSKSQTITLHTSTDYGASYTKTEITSSNFVLTAGAGDLAGVNAVKFTFSSSSNQVGIESLEYTLASSDVLVAPSFSPKGGTFYELPMHVKLTVADEEAAIKYSLDGATYTDYDAATGIDLQETATVYAKAVKGAKESEVASYTFTYVELAEKSIAEFIAAADKTTPFKNANEWSVAHAYGHNIYVRDAQGNALCLYNGGADFTGVLLNGDVIPAGKIYGTYDNYSQGNHEMVIKRDNWTDDIEEGGAVLPVLTDAAEITVATHANKYVDIQGVEFAAATPDGVVGNNYTGTVGETTLTFRNTYKLASVEAGTYSVAAIVTAYNGALQIIPVEFSTYTAVEGVNADAKAAKATKVVENGVIYIVKDGVRYNTLGARVK